MRQILAVIAVVYCLHLLVRSTQTAGFCTTPDQKFGNCIPIKNCSSLLNLLVTRSDRPDVLQFLRASKCGYERGVTLVCCARNSARTGNGNGDEVEDSNEENSAEMTAATQRTRLPVVPHCGGTNVTNPRIVNGVPAKLGEFPWMVALGYKNPANPQSPKWLCGGSLITSRHILTAAHCVHNRQDLYLARLGDLDLYTDEDGAHPEDIRLIKATIHPDYSPVKFTNDIAILTLAYEPTNRMVWPICLPVDEPLRSKSFVRASPIVAGWGSVHFRGPTSTILQLTLIPVVDNSRCVNAYGNRSVIDDRVLCAGFTRGQKDACEGDSGGPLMYGVGESVHTRFYEIGIVSYGFRCAEPGFPGVYTRVTAFIDWIQRNLD